MNSSGTLRDVWSLVLAGGNGERLGPLVQRWLGRHKPKQYCTFIGSRSMLQHTLDRSDRIIAAERRVTIIARDHAEEAGPHLLSQTPGQVVLQPANRETAAGIFLGLAHIRAQDPNASVMIFPSDHFIYPEEQFVQAARILARAAQQMKHWIFLLGVAPDRPEPEYGYIQPGPPLGWMACVCEPWSPSWKSRAWNRVKQCMAPASCGIRWLWAAGLTPSGDWAGAVFPR